MKPSDEEKMRLDHWILSIIDQLWEEAKKLEKENHFPYSLGPLRMQCHPAPSNS